MNWMNKPWCILLAGAVVFAALGLTGCRTLPPTMVVASLDVPRFMGRWYVIACIPTWIERDAFEATETYEQAADGRILTTFTFRSGSFTGPWKHYHPTGFVRPDTGGSVWGMQFLWPIRADYRVMYVDVPYQLTVIGRNQRDYAWIMARTPQIPPERYAQMVALLKDAGYHVDELRRVPQHLDTP